MSDYAKRWQEANEGDQGKGEHWEAFASAWPALHLAFFGQIDQERRVIVPRSKILIFPEADKLKFCLSPVSGGRVAFGTWADVTGGFDGLNHELAEGRYEWKNRRR